MTDAKFLVNDSHSSVCKGTEIPKQSLFVKQRIKFCNWQPDRGKSVIAFDTHGGQVVV